MSDSRLYLPGAVKSYSTAWGDNETPLSQGSKWLNGAADGLDWQNMVTVAGLCYGTQVGDGSTPHDSVAILADTGWSPNQYVEGKVKTVNQHGGNAGSDIYQELEIRLRMSLSAHNCAGYEVSWRCNHDGTQYHQIGPWNGAATDTGPILLDMRAVDGCPGLFDGDIVAAQIIGNVITTFLNGTLLATVTDTSGAGGGAKFTSGTPGIGHWLHNGVGTGSDYAFRNWKALNL